MAYGNLPPEFYVLPPGPNGLPDLIIVAVQFSRNHGVVRVFIVPSDPASTGYWCERFEADGDDAIQWSMRFATQKIRQYSHEQRAGSPAALAPFKFTVFDDWVTLSVQHRLGYYPMLQAAAAQAQPVAVQEYLGEKLKVHEVQITPEHFQGA